MALVNPKQMIIDAQKGGYAIAAFNVHNLETIQAVVRGAVKLNAPVMIATTPGTLRHAGIENIAAMVRLAGENNDIPIALHMDHCGDYEMLESCVKHGYTSLMIDASKLPYEENVALTRRVVELGHGADICVESELGKIGGTEDDLTVDARDAAMTVPEEAVDFVQKTGIDTLAVAIGTAHGVYKGEPKLDYDRLDAIRKEVSIPLVLHGASGVPSDSVQKAIGLGICKVNIATELKIPFADAIKEVFKNDPEANDPRTYMGAGRDAAQAMVEYKIKMCNSQNRA